MTGGRGRGSILSSAQEESSRPARSTPTTGEVSVLGEAVNKAGGKAPAATSSADPAPSHAAVPKKSLKGNCSEAKVDDCLSAESGTHPSISLPASSPRRERNPTKGGGSGDNVDGSPSLPLSDGRRLRQRHKNGCASALLGSRNLFREGAAGIATDGTESAEGQAKGVQRVANGPGDGGTIEDASSGARSCGAVAASANSEEHSGAIVPDKKTHSFSEQSAGKQVSVGGDEEKKDPVGDLAARGDSCGGRTAKGAPRSLKEDAWRSEERAKPRKGGDVRHSDDADDASFWCPPYRVSG